jgi:hypothetical protein
MILVILYVQVGFSETIAITSEVDSSAFPILVYCQLPKAAAPYTAYITVDTPLLGKLNKKATTQSSRLVIALPTNLNQSVFLHVLSEDGVAATKQIEISIPIAQFQGFLLDEKRYSKADVIFEDLDEHIAGRENYVGAHDYFVLYAPFGFNGGKDPIAVDWPAHYLVESEVGTSLLLTVKANTENRLPIRGMRDDYAGRALGYTHLEEQFRRMSQTGVNAIQFIKQMSMDSETDTRIYDPNPMPNRDEALREGMRGAKAAGFKVMFRLVIFLNAPWPRADNLHDRLKPLDWEEWFKSYTNIVLKYAKLCEEVEAEIYAFSDTLQTTYQFEENYRELIHQLRTVYSGKLTVLTGPYDENLHQIGFWDALDYIGIDGSLFTTAYVSFEEANKLSLDEIYAVFVQEFKRNVMPTVEATGKPILWGEIFYSSVQRSTYSPSGVPMSQFISGHDYDDAIKYQPEVDFQQQAYGYSAMLRLMQTYSDITAGSFCLQWTLEDPIIQWCCSARTLQIPFTSAQDVFRLWWKAKPYSKAQDVDLRAVFQGIEYAEFSRAGYRGFWDLDSFGASTATFEETIRWANCSEMDVVSFKFSNPKDDFLRLRYTMNPSQRDYTDWDGVAIVVAAPDKCFVKIEVAFSDWTAAYSKTQKIGPIPQIFQLPFADFKVEPDESTNTIETEIDRGDINAVAIWPISREGQLSVYAVGVYRENR